MKMRFWEKWKKKKKDQDTFEAKFEELDATVLTEKDYKNGTKVEQYVVERLEQMIDITREIEDEKAEYRMVTAYLNDIHTIEDLPEEVRKQIDETATNIVQLDSARNGFLNSAKKLTDAQFSQLAREEKEIPDAIRRLASNEAYQDMLRKDMKYLEREKSRFQLHKEYLTSQQHTLRRLLYVLMGLTVAAFIVLFALQEVLKVNMYYGYAITLFVAVVSICVTSLKISRNNTEIHVSERSINRAITLLNKVKFKYVNITNAIDYACEKYHVKRSAELNQMWEDYMEAVKEREKYQKTSEDLDYFNGRLVRLLKNYQLSDAQIWTTQAIALVDHKEMVEITHNLVTRRQKLRDRMEYNLNTIQEQKKEAEQLMDKVGDKKAQVQEIIQAVDRLTETM